MYINRYALLSMIGVISIAVISCYGLDSKRAGSKTPGTGSSFVVVELFTSEGCSNCPPADALLGKLASENSEEVYLLSYHVDYWDRLGWKDAYSNALFSERQRNYAKQLMLESVYTPQIIVNGTNEFVGSNEARLRSALKNVQPSNLTLKVSKPEHRLVHVSYTINDNSSDLLHVAFVQPRANTFVKRGENRGRELHHVNIVRYVKTIDTNFHEGELTIEIPEELNDIPLELIAFTQRKVDFKIAGAARAAIR